MKKMSKKKLLLALILLLVILIPAGMAASVREPSVEVLSVKSGGTKVSPPTLTLIVTVRVTNPNIFGAALLRTGGQVFLNGNYLGDFSRDTPADIPAGGATNLDVNFDMTRPPYLKNPSEVRVVGSADITVFGMQKSVPFDKTETVYW